MPLSGLAKIAEFAAQHGGINRHKDHIGTDLADIFEDDGPLYDLPHCVQSDLTPAARSKVLNKTQRLRPIQPAATTESINGKKLGDIKVAMLQFLRRLDVKKASYACGRT